MFPFTYWGSMKRSVVSALSNPPPLPSGGTSSAKPGTSSVMARRMPLAMLCGTLRSSRAMRAGAKGSRSRPKHSCSAAWANGRCSIG